MAQTNKFPLQELIFAIVANHTIGTGNNYISAAEIQKQLESHAEKLSVPKWKRNTLTAELKRMVNSNWLTKVDRGYYAVSPNQINTVWADRLYWLEFLNRRNLKLLFQHVSSARPASVKKV